MENSFKAVIAEVDEWQSRFEQRIAIELEQQGNNDAAHDLSHARRVWRHCLSIMEQDDLQVEPLVLLAAAYFHDIVNVSKHSKERKQASSMAAEQALIILRSMSFPSEHLGEVKSAIESHSYSANLRPKTSAAKIVQDADRLEALGALGIARVFYVAGQMNSKLFDPEDPWAKKRELNDLEFAIDHFYVKLFNIASRMQTQAGRRMAEELTQKMKDYLVQLKNEIS